MEKVETWRKQEQKYRNDKKRGKHLKKKQVGRMGRKQAQKKERKRTQVQKKERQKTGKKGLDEEIPVCLS